MAFHRSGHQSSVEWTDRRSCAGWHTCQQARKSEFPRLWVRRGHSWPWIPVSPLLASVEWHCLEYLLHLCFRQARNACMSRGLGPRRRRRHRFWRRRRGTTVHFKLRSTAVRALQAPPSVCGPPGCRLTASGGGCWLAGWLAGWRAGWLAGWMDGWMGSVARQAGRYRYTAATINNNLLPYYS